jgi:hypothetical protein
MALNVFLLKSFRVAIETPGDGVYVSVFIR